MRVRQLQSFIRQSNLQQTSRVSELRALVLGVDASWWVHTLPGLQDPASQVAGGLPIKLQQCIDSQLDYFEKENISPIFVFDGVVPSGHGLFGYTADPEFKLTAWAALRSGKTDDAERCLSVTTSRGVYDVADNVFRHLLSRQWAPVTITDENGKGIQRLRRRNFGVIRAPGFSIGQLVYFAKTAVVDAVFGNPAMTAQGIERVISMIDFPSEKFEWISLQQLLSNWNVTATQYLESCLMAGTEYSLTLPWLNFKEFNDNGPFSFRSSLRFSQSETILGYLETFPKQDGKEQFLKGYALAYAMFTYHLATQGDGRVAPVSISCPATTVFNPPPKFLLNANDSDGQSAERSVSGHVDKGDADREPVPNEENSNSTTAAAIQKENNTSAAVSAAVSAEAALTAWARKLHVSSLKSHVHAFIPVDYAAVCGSKLPNALYMLMTLGIVASQIPTALATGQFHIQSQLPSTLAEYASLIRALRPLRLRAIGLVAKFLNSDFHKKKIVFQTVPQLPLKQAHNNQFDDDAGLPDISDSPIHWVLSEKQIHECLKEHPTTICDIPFCLRLHRKATLADMALVAAHCPFFVSQKRICDHPKSIENLKLKFNLPRKNKRPPLESSSDSKPKKLKDKDKTTTTTSSETMAHASLYSLRPPGSPASWITLDPPDLLSFRLQKIQKQTTATSDKGEDASKGLSLLDETLSQIYSAGAADLHIMQKYFLLIVQFIFLENLGYFTSLKRESFQLPSPTGTSCLSAGVVTMLGLCVGELASGIFQSEILVAVELLRLQLLSGNPYTFTHNAAYEQMTSTEMDAYYPEWSVAYDQTLMAAFMQLKQNSKTQQLNNPRDNDLNGSSSELPSRSDHPTEPPRHHFASAMSNDDESMTDREIEHASAEESCAQLSSLSSGEELKDISSLSAMKMAVMTQATIQEDQPSVPEEETNEVADKAEDDAQQEDDFMEMILTYKIDLPSEITATYSSNSYLTSVRLISRVACMITPAVQSDHSKMAVADLDLDLANFSALVRETKLALTVLLDGCIGHVLLQNLKLAQIITPNLLDSSKGCLPHFKLCNTWIGSVFKFLMTWIYPASGPTSAANVSFQFAEALSNKFQNKLSDIHGDIIRTLEFWCQLKSIVVNLGNLLKDEPKDFQMAHEYLMTRIILLLVPFWLAQECEQDNAMTFFDSLEDVAPSFFVALCEDSRVIHMIETTSTDS